MNKNLIKYLILLSSIEFISYVKAENQCKTDTDCAKYNTDGNTHVCIRLDGHNDYGCYLDSDAYCDSDAACQKYNSSFKFCYTPPWISNATQKQCFKLHETGGTCLEDTHCAEGLSCTNHVCIADINAEAVKNPALIIDVKGANSDETNFNKDGTNPTTDDTDPYTEDIENDVTNDKTKSASKIDPSKNSDTSSLNRDTDSSYIDLDEDDENKKKPIEILGLPLWAFVLLTTVPIIFIIAVLWGLAIGRRSYREEEERKKGAMALKNSKKDLEINYNGASSENLLPKSQSDLKKEDTFKTYVTGSEKSRGLTSNASSNSTISNNLTAITIENQLNNKSSQQTLEVPKTRKPKKSNAGATSPNMPQKPKKPKSTVSSEYSDSNSHRGLLSAGGPMGTSASESGAYPNYFGSAASSTVTPGYFAQNPIPPDPAMNAYYYQQYMAAQAAQIQAAQAQPYMNPYLIDQGLMNGGMPPMDMLQYQHMYGVGMGMPMSSIPPDGSTSDIEKSPVTHKKHKHKK